MDHKRIRHGPLRVSAAPRMASRCCCHRNRRRHRWRLPSLPPPPASARSGRRRVACCCILLLHNDGQLSSHHDHQLLLWLPVAVNRRRGARRRHTAGQQLTTPPALSSGHPATVRCYGRQLLLQWGWVGRRRRRPAICATDTNNKNQFHTRSNSDTRAYACDTAHSRCLFCCKLAHPHYPCWQNSGTSGQS